MSVWHPLTPDLRAQWAKDNRTLWFRDDKGQLGFGTYQLAVEMKARPVEIREIGDE